MAETDYSSSEENVNKIDDIADEKQKATNELYFYISNELSKNYYNYIDLLNNKDFFYRNLKSQADELRKQRMRGISILVNIICWIIFFIFVGLILA